MPYITNMKYNQTQTQMKLI